MKAKILVIDDDALVLQSFRKLLQTQGYEVTTADSGEEGVNLFCQDDFDLVISDIKMPGQDGLETIQKIKDVARRLGKNAAYIFVTGYSEDPAAQKAAAFGVCEFILKPVDANNLLECVDREIQLIRRETEQTDSNAELIPPASTIGRWQYPKSKIRLEKYVTCTDTTMLGGGDFHYYQAWQEELKDLLWLQHPDAREWVRHNPHIRLVIQGSNYHFYRKAEYGEQLRIEANTREIGYCSFIMTFRFIHAASGEVISFAWQKLCSVNTRNQKTCRLPRFILDLIEPIREESPPVPVKR